LFRRIIFFERTITASRIGRDNRSMRCTHFSARPRLAFSLSVAISRRASFCGTHSGRLRTRLRPISRIEAPNTVLSPGIDTGMMKMAESRITISNRPSSPSALSRVPTRTWSPGSSSIICSICWARGALSSVSGAR